MSNIAIVTDHGLQKIAEAIANSGEIVLESVVLGDSSGISYEPISSMTSLKHTVATVPINDFTVALQESGNAKVTLKSYISAEVGGFYIREVGILDEDGELFAIAQFSELYKPDLDADGTVYDIFFELEIYITNAENVTITIKSSNIIVTEDTLRDHHHTGVSPMPTKVLLTDGAEVQGTLPASMVEDIWVHRAGDTVTGDLDFGSSNSAKIKNLKPSTQNGEAVVHEQLQDTVIGAVQNAVPAGIVVYLASSTIPTGYLVANGAKVSKTTYSALYSAIGDTYGTGTLTEFVLPDLRDVFIRGLGNNRTIGSYQADSYLNHNHGVTDNEHTHTYDHFGHYHDFAVGTGGLSGPTFPEGGMGGSQYSGLTQGVRWVKDNQGNNMVFEIKKAKSNVSVNNSTTGGTETRPKNVALIPLIKY